MKKKNLGLEFWVHWLVLGAVIDDVEKFKRLLTIAAQNGAVGIELPWKPLMQLSADEVAKALLEVGIKKAALYCFWGAGGIDPLVRGDEKKAMRQLEAAATFLGILKQCGIEVVGITGSWLFQIGKEYRLTSRLYGKAERIAQEVGNIFGEVGMTANLETLRAEEDLFFPSTDAASCFVGDLSHPAVRLHLDTFHIDARGEHIAAELVAAAETLGWLHASGRKRYTPGTLGDAILWANDVHQGIQQARLRGGSSQVICFEGFSPEFRKLVPEIGKGFPKDLPPERAVLTAHRTLWLADICK